MLKFITKEKITKSVCNSNSTLSTGYRCVVRLRYDLSAFCECDGCQAQPPVHSRPPDDEWRKTGLSRGGTGEGPEWEVFLVES